MDGFEWMDEPPRARPTAASPAPAKRAPTPGRLKPLEPWQRADTSWRGRLLSVARSALFGRKALLGACLELTEALSAELRHALVR